jgi:DNA adenine methylase
MPKSRITSPFPYFGGKTYHAPWIVSHFPNHDLFVDVFGGAGSVILAKEPSKLDVFNDIDKEVINFFRVLRDDTLRSKLVYLLDYTPYAREELRESITTLGQSTDSVENARRFFSASYQVFSGTLTNSPSSWAFGVNPRAATPRAITMLRATDRLHAVAMRFKQIMIDCQDFEKILRTYDQPHALFYLDPPYVPETRKEKTYRFDMKEEDHKRLLKVITHVQAKVILSGYSSPLYEQALSGWRRVTKQAVPSSIGRTKASRYKGDGAMQGIYRTEVLWMNFDQESA